MPGCTWPAGAGRGATLPRLARHPAWAAARAQLRRFELMSDMMSDSVPVRIAYCLRDGLVCA